MVEYNKVNVKLSHTQLKKLKNAAKNKTGTTLRISFKMFITWIVNNKTKSKTKKCF